MSDAHIIFISESVNFKWANIFFAPKHLLYHCSEQFLHSIKSDDTPQFALHTIKSGEEKQIENLWNECYIRTETVAVLRLLTTFQNCMKMINIENLNIEQDCKRCLARSNNLRLTKMQRQRIAKPNENDLMPKLHFITQPFVL